MNYEERNPEEVKEKKKSFFSQAQIESIRKSEEEMNKKEETTKVKAVEVREVQKANVREVQKQEAVSKVVYVTDYENHCLQKFTSEGILSQNGEEEVAVMENLKI